MATPLNRRDIARIVGNDSKLIQGFEQVVSNASDAADAVTAQAEATTGLQNATVITASSNDAFANELILAAVNLSLQIKNGQIIIASPITANGPGRKVLNFVADTAVTFPAGGKLATTVPPGPYADDPTAASNGVGVGEMYAKTGGTVAWRIS